MVREENKNIIIAGGLKHSLASLTLYECLIALEHSLEDLGSHMRLIIVNFDSSINIDSWILISRLVEHLSFKGVGEMMGDIVVGQRNYAICVISSFN